MTSPDGSLAHLCFDSPIRRGFKRKGTYHYRCMTILEGEYFSISFEYHQPLPKGGQVLATAKLLVDKKLNPSESLPVMEGPKQVGTFLVLGDYYGGHTPSSINRRQKLWKKSWE